MKIELTKKVKLFQLEFIGEVDFFEKSPYIKLLENIKNENELRIELESKQIPESAIKNILNRLKELKVIKEDRTIENLENGFPEREYGKYILEIFKNDTKLPFEYKNKDIKRKEVISSNRAENIKQNKDFIEMVQDKDNKKFKINYIENDKGIFNSAQKEFDLTIKYQNNNWTYNINNQNYKMDKIEFKNIFFDEWSEEDNSLKVTFEKIRNNDNYIRNFVIDKEDEIEIEEYGKFKAKYKNIPIIPKTENDAKKWFLYLLKNEIRKIDRYVLEDELLQLWENLKEDYPKFQKFNLKFDFETILKEFNRNSKYFWFLQASKDLFPFNNKIKPISRILIQNGDFKNKFNFEEIKSLIIIDRYINTLRHFEILEKILNDLENPHIKIHTTKIYKKSELDKINKIINKNNIERIEKTKKELPHDRYWIINDKFIYKTGSSLDGMENCSFDLYKEEDIRETEPILYNIIAGEML
jgi:hypothetical protein